MARVGKNTRLTRSKDEPSESRRLRLATRAVRSQLSSETALRDRKPATVEMIEVTLAAAKEERRLTDESGGGGDDDDEGGTEDAEEEVVAAVRWVAPEVVAAVRGARGGAEHARWRGITPSSLGIEV